MRLTRRDFLRITGTAAGGAAVLSAMPSTLRNLGLARAATASAGLSDPALQPKFATPVPNALDPGFKYAPKKGKIKVAVGQSVQQTGLVAIRSAVTPVPTTVWGYGDQMNYTWPGRTFEVQSGEPLEVKWENRLIDAAGLPLPYLLTGKDNTSLGFADYSARTVVDTNLHWAYSLPGYQQNTIDAEGVPIVVHLHGGHTDSLFDGNPEFFFSPGWTVTGPQLGGQEVRLRQRPAGRHPLVPRPRPGHHPAERLRRHGRFLHRPRRPTTPACPATRWACRPAPMKSRSPSRTACSRTTGSCSTRHSPAIRSTMTSSPARAPSCRPTHFPGGGPTALAEFFGDHMVVNGMIWPKMDVEPRNYRLRLLNGCDSRFLAVQFFEVPAGATDFPNRRSGRLAFTVIGSDQGLASSPHDGRHAADGDRLSATTSSSTSRP